MAAPLGSSPYVSPTRTEANPNVTSATESQVNLIEQRTAGAAADVALAAGNATLQITSAFLEGVTPGAPDAEDVTTVAPETEGVTPGAPDEEVDASHITASPESSFFADPYAEPQGPSIRHTYALNGGDLSIVPAFVPRTTSPVAAPAFANVPALSTAAPAAPVVSASPVALVPVEAGVAAETDTTAAPVEDSAAATAAAQAAETKERRAILKKEMIARGAARGAEAIANVAAAQSRLISSQGLPPTPGQAAAVAETAALADNVVGTAAAAFAEVDAARAPGSTPAVRALENAASAAEALAPAASSAADAQAIADGVAAAAARAAAAAPAEAEVPDAAPAVRVEAAPRAVDPAPVSVARRIFKVAIYLSGAALVVSGAVMALVLTAFFLPLFSPVAISLFTLGVAAGAVALSTAFLGASVYSHNRQV